MVIKKIEFKTHQKKWARMGDLWNEFAKPGRPSKDDVKNFRRMVATSIKGKKSPLIVILGSTPEIRNCFSEFSKKQDARIVCVDMTKDMYMAMGQFITRKNPKEKFIFSNWLELSNKLKPQSADVVIGDYVIGNVGGNEDQFLSEIEKVLKPRGCFIVRAHVLDGVKNKFNLYPQLKRVATQLRNKKLSLKEASGCFSNDLLFHTGYLNKDNKLSLSYIKDEQYKKLENKVKLNGDKEENRLLNQFFNSWYQMKDKYWTGYKKSFLDEIIKKYFLIDGVAYSKDYELAKASPIYLLKKK